VLMDVDGALIEGSFKPLVEWPMHTGIYRARPETGGVVHSHARYSTTLACLNWEIPPLHYMLAVLSDEGRVPLARTLHTGRRSSLATPPGSSEARTARACSATTAPSPSAGPPPRPNPGPSCSRRWRSSTTARGRPESQYC
jgi:L-fuculose-phosphate aldolase